MFYSFMLFGNEISTYLVCMCVGIVLSVALACHLAVKRGVINCFDLICSSVYTVMGAMLGAKLLYIAVSWQDILRVIDARGYGFWDSVWYVMQSGFVFYGGFVGGFLALCLYIRCRKCKAFDYFTLYATVLPLGHAVGRVGCFLSGCCYGMEYNGVFSVDFPIYPGYEGSPTVSRLPIQLLEAAGLLLLFALLVTLYCRLPKKPTLPLWTYLAVYPVFRFVLEFWRGDDVRGRFLILSTSQWISLGILLVAGIAFYMTQVKKKLEK